MHLISRDSLDFNPPIICLELMHHVNEPQSFRNFAHASIQLCLTRTQCSAWLNTTPRGNEMILPTAMSHLSLNDVFRDMWPNRHPWTKRLCLFLPELVPLHIIRITMKISCNTFETFIVTLSSTCHGFGELNCSHSQIQSLLDTNPCNSCSMLRCEFRTHLRTVTPISYLLHCDTQCRGDTSTILHSPTHATMTARVFHLAVR